MGARQERYINQDEDYLEKSIKKDQSLKDIYTTFKTNDLHQICSITLEPNRWNIFHLACWYNNYLILGELLRDDRLDKKFINEPDINKEPPIAICCIVDALECLELLDKNGASKQFNNEEKYRKDLNLNKLCVYHDASRCFMYLNPDLTIESEELDDMYDLAKKNGSDNIASLFEDYKVYEGLESLVEIQEEDPMESME